MENTPKKATFNLFKSFRACSTGSKRGVSWWSYGVNHIGPIRSRGSHHSGGLESRFTTYLLIICSSYNVYTYGGIYIYYIIYTPIYAPHLLPGFCRCTCEPLRDLRPRATHGKELISWHYGQQNQIIAIKRITAQMKINIKSFLVFLKGSQSQNHHFEIRN